MFVIAITCLLIGWAVGFVTYFAVRIGVHELRKFNEEFNNEITEKGNEYNADLQRT